MDPKRKELWIEEEDAKLKQYVELHKEKNWKRIARDSGLGRSANSCRLRWNNYLKPGVRLGNITDEEKLSILLLHFKWGNKWSKIAGQLTKRTDNKIKNFWNTQVKKKAEELKCGEQSMEFLEAMTRTLVERIRGGGKIVKESISDTAYDELNKHFPDLATTKDASFTTSAAAGGGTAGLLNGFNQVQVEEVAVTTAADVGAAVADSSNVGASRDFAPEYGNLGPIRSPEKLWDFNIDQTREDHLDYITLEPLWGQDHLCVYGALSRLHPD